jgi:transcriptional regulator CBF1
MSFTPVAATTITYENMSSTPTAASSKKRKRLSEQSPPKETTTTKRSTLATTNGNAEHGANGQETFSESNTTAKDHNEGSEPDISTTAAAALTAHLNEGGGLSFASAGSNADDRPAGESFDMDSSHPRPSSSGYSYSPTHGTPRTNGSSSQKPAVGSEEWHRVRRDNHKEGEHPFSYSL